MRQRARRQQRAMGGGMKFCCNATSIATRKPAPGERAQLARRWPSLKKRRPPEGGLSLGRKRPKEGICDVSHRNIITVRRTKGKLYFRGLTSHAKMTVLRTPQHVSEKKRPPVGGPAPEKRRPPVGGLESREETPKEGMRGKRRTPTKMAPNAANARTQSHSSSSCRTLRRFYNSETNHAFAAAQDSIAVSAA